MLIARRVDLITSSLACVAHCCGELVVFAPRSNDYAWVQDTKEKSEGAERTKSMQPMTTHGGLIRMYGVEALLSRCLPCWEFWLYEAQGRAPGRLP